MTTALLSALKNITPRSLAGTVPALILFAVPAFAQTLESPEMGVSGNGIVISDDDATPSTEEGTDFGSTPAPGGTVDRTFTIRNASTEHALTLGPTIVSGEFSIVAEPPVTIPPGGSGMFTVRFNPMKVLHDQTAMVSIGNNDPHKHPYNFVVKGTALHVPTGDIEIRGNADAEELVSSLIVSGDTTPSIVDHTDFGSEFVEGGNAVRTFTVHNMTEVDRTLGSVTLDGSPDFSVIVQPDETLTPPSNSRINADGRTRFSILFDPSNPGMKTATVSLTHDGSPNPYIFTIQGAGVAGSTPFKTAFPRIAGIFYRNGAFGDAGYQQVIAKTDLAVLNMYKGWHGGTAAMNDAVNAIKALNPNILLANYTHLEAILDTGANSDVIAQLDAGVGPSNGGIWQPNDWWARSVNPADPTVGLLGHNGSFKSTYLTNVTTFVVPNAEGDRFPQFYAKHVSSIYFTPVPGFDVVFNDNTFYKPRNDIDWDRNGQNDNQADVLWTAHTRAGIAAYVEKLNELHPTKLTIGNSDGQPSWRRGFLRDPEYQRKFDGALAETILGAAGAAESFSGWYNMMLTYWSLMDNTRTPHLVMIGTRITADGKAVLQPARYAGGAPYAFARYAMATVLMDDGYIELHGTNYNQPATPWFDELDLAGTATTNWLGKAIDPPQRGPRQNGVFLRRFENGLAMVNPRTEPFLVNGQLVTRAPQAVDLVALFSGEYFRHIEGVQDPVTNDGTLVTGLITLEQGDGLILQRYIDATAPTIVSLTPSPVTLWPPNQKMVDVTIAAVVTDDVDPAPFTRIVAVTSDEPEGEIAPDWEITGGLTLRLRTERDEDSDGRVYTITVKSTDASGNESTATTTVTVPHNQ